MVLIGVFPPPYGGVTVKSKLFLEFLNKNRIITDTIDVYEIHRNKYKTISILLQCFKAYFSKRKIVYCLDTKRLRFLLMIQCLFRKSLEGTTILAVGGLFHDIVGKHKGMELILKRVRGIWVETDGMRERLQAMGFKNVEVFPNPKSEEGCCKPNLSTNNEPLRLVFFSQISKEKGVEDIIALTRLLDEKGIIDYQLDFYGHVVQNFHKEFEEYVSLSKKVRYCGIFDSTKSNVYNKLNEYDILLFPTHWKTEGVPGILVEAKMAGLAVIASDVSYNDEIVRENQEEGFLLRKDYPAEMAGILQQCYENKEFMNHIKERSFCSRRRYILEEFEYLLKELTL